MLKRFDTKRNTSKGWDPRFVEKALSNYTTKTFAKTLCQTLKDTKRMGSSFNLSQLLRKENPSNEGSQ